MYLNKFSKLFIIFLLEKCFIYGKFVFIRIFILKIYKSYLFELWPSAKYLKVYININIFLVSKSSLTLINYVGMKYVFTHNFQNENNFIEILNKFFKYF